jgi:poly-gamma-glutamate synthesis protein (capsule biosynthesis protein)
MIKILIGGDYYPQSRVAKLIEEKSYGQVFDKITILTRNADYSIVNLECPILEYGNSKITKYGPHLKASLNAVEAIKYAGFDMLTLANNHFFDYGVEGVTQTLKACAKHNVDTVGGGENIAEAKKIFYKKIKGKIFSFINCCEHEYSIADNQHGGSNPLNPVSIYYQILEAKANSDFLIVIVHGGHENYQLPSLRMKEVYRFFVDAGANAVINHHQHCCSGFEMYKNSPILYGIGNFCFDWENKRNSKWNEGALAELVFDDNEVQCKLIPFIQGNDSPGIIFMNDSKLSNFHNEINALNEIIIDDNSLRKANEEYYLSEGKVLRRIFEPYTNRYLHGLRRRNLLPSLISNKQLLAIKNYVECESHNEKLVCYLSQILK